MTLLFQWFKKRPLLGPSEMESIPNSVHIQSELLAQFRKATCDTSHRQNSILARIAILFLYRCPTTIARFVIAFSIRPTIYRVTKWTFSHILQKCREGFTPTLANGNACSTISFETVILRIRAALLHCSPDVVSRTALRFWRVPVDIMRMLSFWICDVREFVWHIIGLSMFCKWRAFGANRRSLRLSNLLV